MGRTRIATNYKMLVLDIDGTLINQAGAISSSDRSAISCVKEKHLTITICTGRSTGASLNILNELQLDGAHIFFDGTLVYDPFKDIEVYSKPLPLDLIEEITDYALKESLPLDLFSRNRYFAIEKSWRTDLRKTFFNVEATITDLSTIWKKEKIIKGGMAVRTPDEISGVKKFAGHFAQRLNLTWTVTPAFPDIQFINITNRNTSKGQALEALCYHLAVPLENVCSIGDGLNDISLLSTSGLGIAMRNAPPELKAVADHVTGDVAESGVAEAIRRFLL